MVNQNTMYELTMSENDEDVDVHYTGKLSCNPRGTEFVLYDDLNDAIGIREGKARRELGVILIGTRQMGQSVPIEFVIPRVQRDGATETVTAADGAAPAPQTLAPPRCRIMPGANSVGLDALPNRRPVGCGGGGGGDGG